MSDLTVFIEDQIRDQRVRVILDENKPIEALIEELVEKFGLPRRDFDLSHIKYRLVRAVDGTYFSDQTTLRQANISTGELLQLVSPDGSRVWRAVQKILDEIESEAIDRVKGKLKDKVVDEVQERVKKKLDEVEKTQIGGERVQRLRDWIDKVGGAKQLGEIAKEAGKTAGPARATNIFRWGLTVVAVGGTLLVSRLVFPPQTKYVPTQETRIVPETVEVTRIVQEPVEVTRIVPETVEVTRVVTPVPAVATKTPTVTPTPTVEVLDFSFHGFRSAAGLNLVGQAAQSGNVLRLATANPSRNASPAGAAWLTSKPFIQNGFATTFQFQITNLTGGEGADGFAFVIQNSSTSALGAPGGYIGYGGIANSLAVEFDTWDNGVTLHDPNNNHISVQTRGTQENSPDHTYSLNSTTEIPYMSDGDVHIVSIEYTPGTLTIYLDDLINPVLMVSVNLANTLNLDYGQAWVGFTAATGASKDNYDILTWSFTSTP